jgi:hypothetical protein
VAAAWAAACRAVGGRAVGAAAAQAALRAAAGVVRGLAGWAAAKERARVARRNRGNRCRGGRCCRRILGRRLSRCHQWSANAHYCLREARRVKGKGREGEGKAHCCGCVRAVAMEVGDGGWSWRCGVAVRRWGACGVALRDIRSSGTVCLFQCVERWACVAAHVCPSVQRPGVRLHVYE